MDLRAALAQCPIAAILRGVKPEEIDAIGDALIEAGVTVIEVPLNSPQPFDSIKRLAARHAHHALIGAGTVLEAADVARVKDAGGRLMVAPNFDAEVVRAAKAAGLATLPGVMTPSEGFAALKAGADGLKLFPAEIIPPAVFKAWRAVLPVETLMLAVGGVGVDNIAAYRGGGRVGLRDRLGAVQAGPSGGRNREARQGPGPGRKSLIFRPFWPISPLREVRPLVRQMSCGRFIAFGRSTTHDQAEPWHAISGSPPIRGGAASRRAFRSAGARRPRANAGR